MAFAVQLDFEGATLEDYDKVSGILGFPDGGAGPRGSLFHWATATPTGLRISDVWADREAFDRFQAEQVGPTMAQAGIDIQPEVTFFDVHCYHTAGE